MALTAAIALIDELLKEACADPAATGMQARASQPGEGTRKAPLQKVLMFFYALYTV